MASTRQATGNSKPRVFPKVEEAAAAVKKAGKKRGPKKSTGATTTKGTKAKANTSKPRAKKVSADKVTKPAAKKPAPKKTAVKKSPAAKEAPTVKAPAAPTHEPGILEKISGAILKVEGAILGKPGKKVRMSFVSCALDVAACALSPLRMMMMCSRLVPCIILLYVSTSRSYPHVYAHPMDRADLVFTSCDCVFFCPYLLLQLLSRTCAPSDEVKARAEDAWS